jgi:hypothetical protein
MLNSSIQEKWVEDSWLTPISRSGRHMKVDLTPPTIMLTVLLCFGLHAQQQAPALSLQDIWVASSEFQNYISPELELRNETLHDARTLPDGSRGYFYTPSSEIGTIPYTGDPHKDSLIRLNQEVCMATAIVIAKAGSASSYLIHRNQGIITARSFHIVQVLSGDLKPDGSVAVVQFGGMVRDGSETLEVRIEGAQPIVKEKDYLLFLKKARDYPSSAYLSFNFSPPRVISGHIYSTWRGGDEIIDSPYGVGDTVEKFKSNVDKATSLYKCD